MSHDDCAWVTPNVAVRLLLLLLLRIAVWDWCSLHGQKSNSCMMDVCIRARSETTGPSIPALLVTKYITGKFFELSTACECVCFRKVAGKFMKYLLHASLCEVLHDTQFNFPCWIRPCCSKLD